MVRVISATGEVLLFLDSFPYLGYNYYRTMIVKCPRSAKGSADVHPIAAVEVKLGLAILVRNSRGNNKFLNFSVSREPVQLDSSAVGPSQAVVSP